MLSLMPLCLFSVCVAYAFCMLRLVTAALEAPIGYEDAAAFHYGLDPLLVKSDE